MSGDLDSFHFDEAAGVSNEASRDRRELQFTSLQFVEISVWHATINPLFQFVLFALGHMAGVQERSEFWVGMPGRHSLLFDHFDHHRPPTDNFGIVR